MKNIVIYSPYPCLVKAGDKEMTINENEHLNLDAIMPIYVYPTGKTKRYSFMIDFNILNSQFYSIIEKDDRVLVFLIDGLLSQNIDIFSFRYNNIDSEIEISSHEITFKTKEHKKKIYIYSTPKNVECGNFYHIDYSLLEFENGSILIAYNVKNNSAKQFKGDKIELKDNGFTVQSSKNFYDMATWEYKIDKEGLKIKDKTFAMANQKYPFELIPFQFMTAVQNDDTSMITSLLSDEILKKIDIVNIKKYFGHIDYFYMIDYKTCFAISDKQNVIYEFYLKENKIDEIVDNRK